MSRTIFLSVINLQDLLPEGHVLADGAKITLPNGEVITYGLSQIEKKIRKLQEEYDSLTTVLKSMLGTKKQYPDLWNKRVDIAHELRMLTK